MVIHSSSPTRISLIGGGTDIPTYSNKYGGLCLSMAINLRQEIEIDETQTGFEIPKKANPEFYKAFFEEYRSPSGFRAKFNGEITGGIGSSASASVAILGALRGLTNNEINRSDIAEEAWKIEVNKLKMFGGKQDQYAAAYGGVNLFEFNKKSTKVTPLTDFIEPIKNSILLFYTGRNRKSSKIQEGFKKLDNSQTYRLNEIKKLVPKMAKAIAEKDIKEVGEILNLSWELKKRSNNGVSTTGTEFIINKGKKYGAYGGKILGAGGGGYCIFIVDPNKKEEFIKTIGIKHIPYEIDYEGLKIWSD